MGVVVVHLPVVKSPLDISEVQRALDVPLERGDVQLVVDTSLLSSLCTTSIGYLVHSLQRARKLGGDIRLYGRGLEEDGSLRKFLGLCGLGGVFRIFESEEDAVNSYDADT